MKHDYAKTKLECLLRDLNSYTADEFRRQMMRIAGGATGEDIPDDAHTIKTERDALAAQVEHLCYQITNIALCYDNNTGHEPSLSVFHRALHEAQEFIENTSQQCLAEIRAEAVLAYLATLQPIHPAQIWLEIHLTQYAEQIRQGGEK